MATELGNTSIDQMIPVVPMTGRLRSNELWVPSTTQKHPIGMCYRTWGTPSPRSFYYGYSGEALYPDRVAAFYPQVHYSSGYLTAAAITGYSESYGGDRQVQLTNASQTFTKNQLAGGMLVLGHAAAANTEFRMITGNTASATSPGTETITIYVDDPFSLAHAASTFAEVMVNPWNDIRYGGVSNSDLAAPAGVAPAGCTAAGFYAWFQTWGPRYLCPGGGWTSQGVAGERYVVRVGDGSVNGSKTTAGANFPVVGEIIQRDTSGSGGPPFVDLRIRY